MELRKKRSKIDELSQTIKLFIISFRTMKIRRNNEVKYELAIMSLASLKFCRIKVKKQHKNKSGNTSIQNKYWVPMPSYISSIPKNSGPKSKE
ncbi:MAG: hypothetical protein ABF242_04385 [Flavobacteriales bacterium]